MEHQWMDSYTVALQRLGPTKRVARGQFEGGGVVGGALPLHAANLNKGHHNVSDPYYTHLVPGALSPKHA